VSFVWGQPAELDRLKDLVNATLFTIGEKEVTLAAIAGLLGIFALTVVVNRLVGRFIDRHIFAYFTWDVGVRHAFLAVLKYVILFVGFTLGLEFIGVGLSALALFAGVIGIGIGFGLQNIASNFIAGLIILFERPIKKGDYVDLGGLEGRVERISARATTLHTTDNVSVIVPNSEFIGGRVVNLSHGDTRVRIHVPVGVAYGSDVPKVHKALREAAAGCKEVLEAPAPSVRMNAFGDSAVSFSLLVWIDDFGRKGDIVSALNHAIELKFREQGIEIPFPQTDVHIRTPGK
jgi:small-conductance mechanosensitive channel